MNNSWDHIWLAIQALGSIAAVWAAVWVGWATIRAENNRIKARGRVVAFRLSPTIVTIRGECSRAREASKILRSGTPAGTLMTSSQLIQRLHIIQQIPTDVFAESWTLPPQTALCVSQLENILGSYSRLVENGHNAIFAGSAALEDFLNRADQILDAIEQLSCEINKYVANVSDEVALTTKAHRL